MMNKNVLGNIDEDKRIILYSRDYRHLNRSKVLYIFELLVVIVPLVFFYLMYYSDISYVVANFARKYVAKFTGQKAYVYETDFFPHFGNIYGVTTKGSMPSFVMSLIVLIASLLGILILSSAKTSKKPMVIFFLIGLYISFFSAGFFLICPQKFPYTVSTYSVLYMKQQIVLWFMILIVYVISVSLVKGMYMFKFITFSALTAMMAVYGTLRYVIYLTIIVKGSYIFMATLYFTFGVMFDFMIMIGIYSIFMKRVSGAYRTRKGGLQWKW